MANRVEFNLEPLIRATAKLRQLTGKEVTQTRTRIVSGLKRRLPPEAARQASEKIFNLTPRQISPYLIVNETANGLSLVGKSSRLPVSAFKPTWGGPSSPGVTVQFWRDGAPLVLPHTFVRDGTKTVWQRVPGTRSKTAQTGTGRDSQRHVVRAASGLVGRLPIVQRKGPSFARGIFQKKHGDIYPGLTTFCQSFVVDEAGRLVKILVTK